MHKTLLLGLTVAIVACGQSQAPHLPSKTPPATTSAAISPPSSPEHIPIRLQIPSIGVDAAVESVGVDENGNMATPSQPDNVGWYEPGPAPGSGQGDVVMDGHLDRNDLSPAVFWHLALVKVSDEVDVATQDGTVRYRVTDTHSVGALDRPVGLFALDGPPELSLITCGGRLVGTPGNQHYADRLLVTAMAM